MPICASVFSMKYPARRCSAFSPLICASRFSILCKPTTGPVLSGLSAPKLLSVTACVTPPFSSALAIDSVT